MTLGIDGERLDVDVDDRDRLHGGAEALDELLHRLAATDAHPAPFVAIEEGVRGRGARGHSGVVTGLPHCIYCYLGRLPWRVCKIDHRMVEQLLAAPLRPHHPMYGRFGGGAAG